jgi:hypothetical protein
MKMEKNVRLALIIESKMEGVRRARDKDLQARRKEHNKVLKKLCKEFDNLNLTDEELMAYYHLQVKDLLQHFIDTYFEMYDLELPSTQDDEDDED